MLLGEVLTHSLTWYGASPDVALSCAAAAWDLGLKEVADCREPYNLFTRGQPSPLWTALASALEAAGMSPAVKEKVLRNVVSALTPADGVRATAVTTPTAAAVHVAAPAPAPAPAPATTRSDPATTRGRPRGSREHVLPDELSDLTVVSARLARTIELYDRCAKLEKARAPG
jgi:hypothetical protein